MMVVRIVDQIWEPGRRDPSITSSRVRAWPAKKAKKEHGPGHAWLEMPAS